MNEQHYPKKDSQITRMLPKYSIGRKIATQDGIQYITVTNDKRYTKMEFLQLFHIILWVIYETYTGRRKKDIIPSFAYCLCKETPVGFLSLFSSHANLQNSHLATSKCRQIQIWHISKIHSNYWNYDTMQNRI